MCRVRRYRCRRQTLSANTHTQPTRILRKARLDWKVSDDSQQCASIRFWVQNEFSIEHALFYCFLYHYL